MSKHKRFHGMRGKGAERKSYAFFHSKHPNGSVRGAARYNILKSQAPGNLAKETAPSAANAESGKQTPQSN